ncbi:FtsB family cell division protein [Aeribacillus pallidus]|uniref:Cell division protein DIVIC n=1 Tax=Aeribacillus pallidus TaxID=33936 RepID=A0A223E3E0_9BACI|nr:septum formation initiator family protein [Aeribacillus pallidus]ASS89733.1 hypothetical protein AP3564_05235 [Aeribacillus pallidus]
MREKRELNVAMLQQTNEPGQEVKAEMRQRRKRGLIRRLAAFGIMAVTCIAIMASALVSQSIAINKKLEEKKQLETKLENLKEEEKDLKAEIIKLKDEEYITKLARKDYFLSDEGEVIFNIPGNEQ